MKKLLVHLHIFYHDQVDYFISKLKNISDIDWDLLVTCSEYNKESEQKLRAFRPDAAFLEVENVGYDVWPFIKVLQQTDLSGYEYIMKLHTKGPSSKSYRINGLRLKNHRWRNILVDSMLKSSNHFRKCIKLMDANPQYGCLCAYETSKMLSNFFPEDMAMLDAEAKRIGISHTDGLFVAGTMFLARLDALKLIKTLQLTPEHFADHVSCSHSGASMAHIYERLLCFAICDGPYTLKRVITRPLSAFVVLLHRSSAPFLRFLFSLEREGEKKIKYLTIFGIKIKSLKKV